MCVLRPGLCANRAGGVGAARQGRQRVGLTPGASELPGEFRLPAARTWPGVAEITAVPVQHRGLVEELGLAGPRPLAGRR